MHEVAFPLILYGATYWAWKKQGQPTKKRKEGIEATLHVRACLATAFFKALNETNMTMKTRTDAISVTLSQKES